MFYRPLNKGEKAARAYADSDAAIADRLRHAEILVQVNCERMQRYPTLSDQIINEVLKWQEARIKELS